jgi:hypothetical protein
MNSKKKSVVISFILMLVLFQQVSFAQIFKFTPGTPSGSYKMTMPSPSLSELNPNQTNPPPFYTLFIETGNGRYLKEETPIHNEYITNPKSVDYNFVIPPNSNALLNIVGHYDTIKPPRRNFVYSNFSNTDGGGLLPQQKLDPGFYVGLDYSHPTVVKNDTMTTVITYRPDIPGKTGQPVTGNCIIAIFYNDPANGGNIFDGLDGSKTYPMVYNDGISKSIQSVKAVRKHGEETGIYTLVNNIPLNGVTDQVANELGIAKGLYQNALYFTVPANAVAEEKNIFLSMAPINSASPGQVTTFKVFIIKYNSSKVLAQQGVTKTLWVDEFARDPNGILTSPTCLDSFPRPYTDRPIKYNVEFQNDGKGIAQKVQVTVFLPEGIPFPSSGLLNITATVKQKGLLFEKYTVPTENSRNTYQFVITRIHRAGEVIFTQRKIIFRMPGIDLPGTSSQPTHELLRHGNISFTLKTEANEDQIPECMYSDISIVFSSFIRKQLMPLAPIRDHILIRKDCKHIPGDLPPCPRSSREGGPDPR